AFFDQNNFRIGTILGANIGTTVTAQIISFKVSTLIYPALGLGAYFYFFGRRRVYKHIGQSILGFGLLFLAIEIMSDAMRPLAEYQPFLDVVVTLAKWPVLGVLMGALFTALIQSSSASTGIIIALTMQGLIDSPSAIALVLGTNIGTCVKAIFASFGSSLTAKRAALAHVLFNTLGVIIVLLFFDQFLNLIMATSTDVPRQAANAHTLFNVLNTLVFLPFFNQFIALIRFLVPGEEHRVQMGPKYLDKRVLNTPSIAIRNARQEILRMALMAREMLADSIRLINSRDRKLITQADQKEEVIDNLEKEITSYLADANQYSLDIEQSQTMTALMHAASDMERIGDHAQNIVELAEEVINEKLYFSSDALRELHDFYGRVDKLLEKALTAFEKEDASLAQEVVEDDDIIDNLEKTLRKHHINRINNKQCNPIAGVIFLDMLSNLERIGDHATNMAQVIVGEF
ncbi:MAG TPA: Na/Pi cotransporter family protein, partial [Firmicutes bacterium]|nr:Na/Pi cotransporter family protein [Bacillota bacterium]